MCGGWSFALIMATMPLLGISDYRKFAVCLPFESDDALSLGMYCSEYKYKAVCLPWLFDLANLFLRGLIHFSIVVTKLHHLVHTSIFSIDNIIY